MEKNILTSAKFGDKFRMRNGKMAIYHMKDKLYANDSHQLINAQDSTPFKVDDSGKMLHIKSEHYFDIVSKWDESIDENKLDELANEEAYKYISEKCRLNNNIFNELLDSREHGFYDGIKVGYRKAKEE